MIYHIHSKLPLVSPLLNQLDVLVSIQFRLSILIYFVVVF